MWKYISLLIVLSFYVNISHITHSVSTRNKKQLLCLAWWRDTFLMYVSIRKKLNYLFFFLQSNCYWKVCGLSSEALCIYPSFRQQIYQSQSHSTLTVRVQHNQCGRQTFFICNEIAMGNELTNHILHQPPGSLFIRTEIGRGWANSNYKI